MQPSRVILTGNHNHNRHKWSWNVLENTHKSCKVMENHFHHSVCTMMFAVLSLQTHVVCLFDGIC